MAKQEPLVIKGTVEDIIYGNEMTGYAVIELLDSAKEQVVAVGSLYGISPGEEVTLYGHWGKHPDYGMQFSVTSYERILPEGATAILRYLSSRTIKGIGPATAARMVKRFGDETFSVIENHPEWLTDISGISAAKATQIHKSFMEQSGVRSLMILCREYFSPLMISRIFAKFGQGAVQITQKTPYALCDIQGLSFQKVDAFASAQQNIDPMARLLAGTEYVLTEYAQAQGHTCLPVAKLVEAVVERLSVSEKEAGLACEELLMMGKLVAFHHQDIAYVGTKQMMRDEASIARRLSHLMQNAPVFSKEDMERMIERLEAKWKISYADEQREALYQAMNGGVLLVTGGPGTGKTTIVRALVSIFDFLGFSVALAAPTGRASMRMSESTGSEAKTIHRLLEMERTLNDDMRFVRNAQTPLEEQIIIVDEASMIDVPLMSALLRAMKNGSRLILIGDADQLPPVGAGQVLSDLIDSGKFPTVRLYEIFRQAKESLIVENAHRVLQGKTPKLDIKDKDFFYLPAIDEQIAPTIADLIMRRLPKAYGKDITSGIQVITPSRKGKAGTEMLNSLLRESLNPKAQHKKELSVLRTTFREGDRVMQTQNNYDVTWMKNGYEGTGIFNGEIGVLSKLSTKEKEMEIAFDDRIATYDFDKFEEIEHAYAITVHKSQGSEYPVVVFPLYQCPPMLLNRNLFYTAMTRAKKMLILVGRREILDYMVQNNREDKRYTTLKNRLEVSK